MLKYCQFQNECIEYKDISYLKNMPICAIHSLSIACHDKINKCKYFSLYSEINKLKQENENLKKYKFLFEKAREFYLESNEWAKKCKAENEDLKDSLRRTVCQSECYKHKEAEKYKKKLDKAEKMIYNYIYYNCDHYEDDSDCVNCNIVCWARDMEEVLFDRKIREEGISKDDIL